MSSQPPPAGYIAVPSSGPPGNVAYYRQQNPNTGTIMQAPVQAPTVVAQDPPKYEYIPNDFMVLSVVTLILCGIFSPLTLTISIPACMLSLLSRNNSRIGLIEIARKQGIVAAYLSITTIIVALVVACIVTGLVVGLYGSYEQCTYYNRRNCQPPYY